MFPLFTKNNARDVCLSDSKSVSNRLLRFSACAAVPYCYDIVACKFARMVIFSSHAEIVLFPLFDFSFWGSAKKNSVIMKSVLGMCAPLKIFELIVRFVAVQMIYLVGWQWRLDKSLEDDPVNALVNHNPVFSEPDTHVSRFLAIRFKNLSVPANSAKIADFVKSLKSRNWFPFLIHRTECLKPKNNNQQECWV